MDRIIDFIERHKFGILITLAIHVLVFVYFQMATYQQAVVYDPWDFQGENVEKPDDIQITPEQIQTPQEQQLLQPEKVSSFVKNENDQRKESFNQQTDYTSFENAAPAGLPAGTAGGQGNPEEVANNYEKEAKDRIFTKRENALTDKGGKREDPKQSNDSNDDTKSEQTASNEAVAGATMVSYRLDDRHPLNHNDWYVRNPGYTCGNVNGIVKVLIVVGSSGEVENAKTLQNQSVNATACMLEKAEQYALKSRFNFSSSAPKKQEGIITYRFVFR